MHLKKFYKKNIRSGCFNMVIIAREGTLLGLVYTAHVSFC